VRALVSAGADVNLQRNDGSSPLSIASEKGYIDTVVILLDNGADIEIRDNAGRTALWCAAAFGHTAVLDVLISRGADVDAADYRLQTPVCEAAMYGHNDIVKRLIQRKSNISGEEGVCRDPLSYAALSVRHVFKAVLQLLMNSDVCVGSEKDCNNRTDLMNALDIVNMSVEYSVDIHARNDDNLQALDIASYCGHVDTVRFLFDQLASHFHYDNIAASYISFGTGTDCNSDTAVHLTTYVKCIKSLLENGADIEAENFDGLRPIHWAVRTGLAELVEVLIQHGANVDAADVYGNRLLHEALCHGLNVVQLLVHHGAKVNVQNVDGKTPLHVAIERQQSEVVMFLLKAGADIGLTDVWRNTALHYLTAGQLQCGEHEYLVMQTKKHQDLLICNAVGVTALSSMAAHGILDYANNKREISGMVASQEYFHSEHVTPALSSSVIPCLLELRHIKTLSKTKVYCRKQPAHVDCYGNTPLHYVVGVCAHLKMYRVSTDVTKTVEFLMKRGADVNAQNNDGLTPLHVARGKEAFEACLQYADDQSFTITDKRGRNFWHLLFLFRSQSEIEMTTNIQPILFALESRYSSDDLNRTPLHYACMKSNEFLAGWKELAAGFLHEFSDHHINKQDDFGRTALHCAAMANKTELMDFLKPTKQQITHFEITLNKLPMNTKIFLLLIIQTLLSCNQMLLQVW